VRIFQNRLFGRLFCNRLFGFGSGGSVPPRPFGTEEFVWEPPSPEEVQWSLYRAEFTFSWGAGDVAYQQDQIASRPVYRGEKRSFAFTPDAETDISGWTIAAYVFKGPKAKSPVASVMSPTVVVEDDEAGVFRVDFTASQTAELTPGTWHLSPWRTDSGNESKLAGVQFEVASDGRSV
jgi:hypothetical protein